MHTLAILLPLLAFQTTSAPAAGDAVVVELFTSEGCSSCPAGDAVLADLAGQPGVIGLAYHVDYWDYLGWKDRFADPAYTTRQRDYARQLAAGGGDGGIYTPQMIVQGTVGFVGSDRQAARKAIADARAKVAGGTLTLQVTPDETTVQVRFRYDGPTEGRTLRVAVVEDDLRSTVRRGENRGKTLGHAAVVRSLDSIAAAAEGAVTIAFPKDLNARKARVVAFVQDARGAIGAARMVGMR